MSTVKFSFALPLSFKFGFNFSQTFIYTTVGGILGVFIFYFFSRWLIRIYEIHFKARVTRIVHQIFEWFNRRHIAEKYFPMRKRNFTKRNRFIIKIRRRWGFIGIIILTPVILSIPIGAFIVARYYRSEKNGLLYLALSVVSWSLLISASVSVF
jgi:uncharacterized membrane protein